MHKRVITKQKKSGHKIVENGGKIMKNKKIDPPCWCNSQFYPTKNKDNFGKWITKNTACWKLYVLGTSHLLFGTNSASPRRYIHIRSTFNHISICEYAQYAFVYTFFTTHTQFTLIFCELQYYYSHLYDRKNRKCELGLSNTLKPTTWRMSTRRLH